MVCAALLAVSNFRPAYAQMSVTPATLPAFDVISVKLNNNDAAGGNINRRDDGFHIENVNLSILIRFAYGLDFDGQMVNVPEWAREARYDIDARVAPEDMDKFKHLTGAQRSLMLQQILTDRFKISIHHEDQQLPIYNLVPAKGGVKTSGVKPVDATKPGQFLSTGDDHISMHNQPITALTAALTRATQRTVIDKTGLTGKYDLELRYTPDNPDPAMAIDDKSRADTEAPTIFTAVQEQLGLKLESAKGPVDCIVIDRIEKPAAN